MNIFNMNSAKYRLYYTFLELERKTVITLCKLLLFHNEYARIHAQQCEAQCVIPI